ncbi:hypothetical protein H9Y04_10815 [Streptomyces sp. TRM66268-LWL]|uniref:Uncharacterized protein n=1 Tax=Streptomyces polyasparticus TaxID=2767826 RepID=A0ABR7SC57_9ACTN|nr:hypothetical protein [Streptomyces polyasparticus]MBC9713060.1 hypothetical protein [Streptomyces polyasparticus]
MAVLCLVGLGAFVALTPVQVASQVNADAAGVVHTAVTGLVGECRAEPAPPSPPTPASPAAPQPHPGAPASEPRAPGTPADAEPPARDRPAPPGQPPAPVAAALPPFDTAAAPAFRPAPFEPVPPELSPPPRPMAHGPTFPVRPYRSALVKRPVPGGFSTVTLMTVVTAPAVLAAAALRPGGRGRSARA